MDKYWDDEDYIYIFLLFVIEVLHDMNIYEINIILFF